ncbi:transporter substrate-binding domain-containing protein [Shewanella halotolerans]|nr:transporter substrate-binding domain-containing protein [Shewanella halotolerans]
MAICRALILAVVAFFSCNGELLALNKLSQLSYYTESYPPYNYRESHQLKGIAVDLLAAAARRVDGRFDIHSIQLVPWARGYKLTRTGKNTVLFSTTRTPYREPLFDWVGPISATRIVIFARADRKISITDEAQLNQYSIGVIAQDIGEQALLAAGIAREQLRHAHEATSLVHMLRRERVDLWAYEEVVGRYLMKQEGVDTDEFEVVFTLKVSELYYAFSRDSDPELRRRLQQGIDKVKATIEANGKTQYENILAKYR